LFCVFSHPGDLACISYLRDWYASAITESSAIIARKRDIEAASPAIPPPASRGRAVSLIHPALRQTGQVLSLCGKAGIRFGPAFTDPWLFWHMTRKPAKY